MIRRAWHRATRTWREAAHIIADEQARAQTPVPPPFASPSGGGAGPGPVPGQQAIPVPAHGRPPRPAPAPAATLTVHIYNDGHAEMLDHIRRRQIVIAADDWDDALERLTRDQH